MLVNERYANEKMAQTPERKFPLNVAVEETRWKFKITFTDNMEIEHPTEWLWKGKLMDNRNQLAIEKVLATADEDIQMRLHQSIRQSMAGLDRERQIEARVNRIMDKY